MAKVHCDIFIYYLLFSTGEQKTRSELEAVESANNANKAKLNALEQLQELLALAAECEQSAAEATEELAKAAQLSNELDEATGALKDQVCERKCCQPSI